MAALRPHRKTKDVPGRNLLQRCMPAVLAVAAVCAPGSICAAAGPRSACIDPATGMEAPPQLRLSLQLANQYLAVGQIARAIPCLESAHQLDPAARDTVSNLGHAYLDSGNLDAAHTLLESQLRSQDDPGLHNLLGVVDTRQSQFREAATQFQLAAQQDPSEQNIFDFGTSLLRFAGSSAEQIFRFGVSRYPQSTRMHLGLGYALWLEDQDVGAAQEMCTAAKLDPADPRVFDMLGDTQQVPAQLQSEITALLAALVQRFPQNGKLLFYDAMASSGVWSGQDLSHLDPVIPLLERALILDPALAGPHFYLARRAEEKGQTAEALAHYEQAARLRPDDDQIAYRLAFAYKKAGNDRMFREELAQFRALHEKAAQNSTAAAEHLDGMAAAK